MDSPPQTTSASGSVIASGSQTPVTMSRNIFQREIDKISLRPTSPTRQTRKIYFEERIQDLDKPETKSHAVQLALATRHAEKGERKYKQLTYESSEEWGSYSQLIALAQFWAYTPLPSLPANNSLSLYDCTALLARNLGEANHYPREKIVQTILEGWDDNYNKEKERRDREIDDPSLRVDEAQAAAAAESHAAEQIKKTGGKFTMRRFKGGSGSGNSSGTSTPTSGQTSPR